MIIAAAPTCTGCESPLACRDRCICLIKESADAARPWQLPPTKFTEPDNSKTDGLVWLNAEGEFLVVTRVSTFVGNKPFGAFTRNLNHAFVGTELPKDIQFADAGICDKLVAVPAYCDRWVRLGSR